MFFSLGRPQKLYFFSSFWKIVNLQWNFTPNGDVIDKIWRQILLTPLTQDSEFWICFPKFLWEHANPESSYSCVFKDPGRKTKKMFPFSSYPKTTSLVGNILVLKPRQFYETFGAPFRAQKSYSFYSFGRICWVFKDLLQKNQKKNFWSCPNKTNLVGNLFIPKTSQFHETCWRSFWASCFFHTNYFFENGQKPQNFEVFDDDISSHFCFSWKFC